MPVNTKPGVGGQKDPLMILIGVLSVASVASSALRGVLNRMQMGVMRLTYFIVRDVAFVPESAGRKRLLW